MSRHLTATVAGYAALLALWALVRAAVARELEPPVLAGVGVLETVLLVAAIAEVARFHSTEPATHAGYIAASVLVLPLALSNLSERRDGWDALIVAVAALAIAVVVLRLRVTGV